MSALSSFAWDSLSLSQAVREIDRPYLPQTVAESSIDGSVRASFGSLRFRDGIDDSSIDTL